MQASSPMEVKIVTSVYVSPKSHYKNTQSWMVLTAVLLLLTEHALEALANLAIRDLDIVLGLSVII